ncbi:phosphate/phosphite/phosphonate ABC transporter substrate-binding protein [Pseudaestuariivita sp.]|uniref:phosphate/phosphite/phosphonate ABC transporter substrate-binding protein n=1 Tax=Pseudaestuariivita sp. TaxID=2211669 RepID=UPI0040591F53
MGAFPMYMRPETEAAHQVFWDHISDALREARTPLARPQHLMGTWRDRGLVLSQTCSLPYRWSLAEYVDLVGTPDYGLAGCPPGYYRSMLVGLPQLRGTGPEDWADLRLALNSYDSQSGLAAPTLHLAAHGLAFTKSLKTGAHVASAQAVIDGKAGIAAIDAHTWRLLERYEPDLTARLIVLDLTEPTPGLPFITAKGKGAKVRAAVETALETIPEETRHALDLKGLIQIPKETYLALPNPPSVADDPAFADLDKPV